MISDRPENQGQSTEIEEKMRIKDRKINRMIDGRSNDRGQRARNDSADGKDLDTINQKLRELDEREEDLRHMLVELKEVFAMLRQREDMVAERERTLAMEYARMREIAAAYDGTDDLSKALAEVMSGPQESPVQNDQI